MNYTKAQIYYFSGTTGWGTTYGGLNTVGLHGSPISSIGVQPGGFGFTITGTNNQVIVIHACTNLVNPNWLPILTNTLNGTTFNFTDAQWKNHPGRFYRIVGDL